MSLTSAGKIGAFGNAFLDSYDRARDRRRENELLQKEQKRKDELFEMQRGQYERQKELTGLDIEERKSRLSQINYDNSIARITRDVMAGRDVDPDAFWQAYEDRYGRPYTRSEEVEHANQRANESVEGFDVLTNQLLSKFEQNWRSAFGGEGDMFPHVKEPAAGDDNE